MAGTRRRSGGRSSSASDLEKRRSSSHSRRVRRRRRSSKSVTAGISVNHVGKERELRDSSTARKRERKVRGRREDEEVSYHRAEEKERINAIFCQSSEGKRRAEDDEKPLLRSEDDDRDMQERRKNKDPQHQASGRRRRYSSGRSNSKYDDGHDTFSSRERGGSSSRHDSSSKYDSSSRRHENNSRRHENSSSSNGKYDTSGKYGDDSSRSARGEDSASKKYEDYSSTGYAYNSRSRYVGDGNGGDRDRKGYAANNAGSHKEGGSNRRENHSSRCVKSSSSSSKYGLPISSGGYSESSTTARHSGGSTRYAKNCNGSSSGVYNSAYSSRDAINNELGRGRWRRLPSFLHAAGIQDDAEERRRRSRRSRYSRSGERDLSAGGRAGRGRGVAGAAHEEGRRGRGGAKGYEEAAPAETPGSRTAGAAGGSERRRRSLNVEEEGLYKRQRILHAAAATIGSRASFLRSNAPPGAPRVGGSSSARELEKVKEVLGKDTRSAGRRSSDHGKAKKDEILQPLPQGGKRDLAEIKDRVNAEKSKSEEEWSKQQQQAHLQRKKEEEQQDQRAEWEQQYAHTEQQHADASKRHALQKNTRNTCSVRPRFGSRGACAPSEKEARQQQSSRGIHASEEAGAKRRDASAETRTYEMRTPADEEMYAAKQKQEEQHQKKKEEQPIEGVVAAKGIEGVRASEKLCISGNVSGGDQQTEATHRKSDTAVVCPGREREESEQDSTQQKKQLNADLQEQDGDKTATTAGRQDGQKAGAGATVVWTSRAEDATKEDGEATAEREEGAARREDKVVAEKGEAGAGKVERAVTADEAATRGGNAYAARRRKEGKAAAGTVQQRKEEILEAGGIEVAATEQSETRATKDAFSSTVRQHVQPAGDRSRDGLSTGETPAGEEEAEDSKASVDSKYLHFHRPPALTQSRDDTFIVANRRSHPADNIAAEAERLQHLEKESEVGAAATDTTAAAAAVPPAPSPASAQGKASDAEAALASEGGAALAEAEVSEGARAPTVAQRQRGSRSEGEEVAGSIRSRPTEDEGAHADAAGEVEEKTTAEARPFCEPTAAVGREHSTLSKNDSSFSAAVAEVAEEREQQQQQVNVEAGEEMRTTTSGPEMHHSNGSWRVVTLDIPNRNVTGSSSVKTRNRESSSSASSSSASSSSSGERCHEAEGSSKKRRRDEEERSEKAVVEERRRIWYRMPASYPSPALQRHMFLPKYSQRPYLVPRSSSSSSSFSVRHYYSPSRPYSPSRDLSPGPSVARPAAYSKSDYHRTVHFPSNASATAASFSARAAAFPRTVVAGPPQFASHGSAAAAASRRGEAVLPLLRERSAAGVSLRIRCGIHSTAPAACVEAAPLARSRLAQQQQQQHERKDEWNPFPAAATVSSPLPRVGGRRHLGEAAVAKFGAAKDPRRKENFKWAHDLFEQVAREPEKTRRRFNLYSENLEIEG